MAKNVKMPEKPIKGTDLVTREEHIVPFRTYFQPGLFPLERTESKSSQEPSETIPNEALSVKELLQRQQRGLPLLGNKVPIYQGDDNDLPDPRTLDLAELQQLREEYTSQLHDIRQRKQKNEEQKKSAYYEKMRKQILDEIKQREDHEGKEQSPATK